VAQIEDLISTLNAAGVSVWAEGGQVRIRGPAQAAKAVVDELTARKAEALDHLLKQPRLRTLPPLVAQPRTGRTPLSLSQWLWYHPRGVPCHAQEQERVPLVLRLSGYLNAPMLQRAYQRLFARHDILRTTYHEDAAGVHQVVGEASPELEVIDLTDLPQADREWRIFEIVLARKWTEVIHAEEFPLRLTLFKIADEEHILAGHINHIAFDFSSAKILFDELIVFYVWNCLGVDVQVEPLRRQYADFARWESSWLTPEACERSYRLWDERLANAPLLDLMAGRQRTSTAQGEARAEVIDIPPELWDGVRAFCRSRGLTPTMVLTGVFSLLLSRWSGLDQVVTGFITNGRPPGLNELIGSFIRSRPYHMDFSADPTFDEMVLQSRAAYLDANDLRRPTGPKVSRERQLGRVVIDITKWPIPPSADTRALGLKVELSRLPKSLITHLTPDVQIRMGELPGSIHGYIGYAADRFSEETIQWFANGVARVLGRALEAPHLRLSQLLPLDDRPPEAATPALANPPPASVPA